MKIPFLFVSLLLSLGFLTCESSSKSPSPPPNPSDTFLQNGFADPKTYSSMFQSLDGADEYKVFEWDSNELFSYAPDGSVMSKTIYDDMGRIILSKFTSSWADTETTYRYEGSGSSNPQSIFDKQFINTGSKPEYLYREWSGNTRYSYASNGNILSSLSFDEKGRETESFVKSSWNETTTVYRYQGKGSSNIYSSFNRQYTKTNSNPEYLSREWQNDVLFFYYEDGTTLSKTTYDEKGRVVKSEPSGSITVYRYVD